MSSTPGFKGPRYLAQTASTIYPGHPLYKWRQVYSGRNFTKMNVVMVGDSVTFDAGIDAVGADSAVIAFQRGVVTKLQQYLNGFYVNYGYNDAALLSGEGGGYHARAAHTSPGSTTDPWIRTGTLTNVAGGQGINRLQLASGASLSHTAKNTTGFLWYFKDGSGAGTPHLKIVGSSGAVFADVDVTMNTGLPAGTTSSAGATLPRGQYTFTFSFTSGTPVVDSLYVLDGDNRSGVKVYNWGWPGAITSDFTTGSGAATAQSAIAGVTPDLVIVMLGTNDYSVGTNPSTFQTTLSTLIDNYRTTAATVSKKPSFLIVSWFPRYDVTSPSFPWSQYVTAMKTVAVSKTETYQGLTVPYCDFLDMTPYFASSATNDADTSSGLVIASPTSGWGVHPTNKGHSWVAELIARRLTLPIAV